MLLLAVAADEEHPVKDSPVVLGNDMFLVTRDGRRQKIWLLRCRMLNWRWATDDRLILVQLSLQQVAADLARLGCRLPGTREGCERHRLGSLRQARATWAGRIGSFLRKVRFPASSWPCCGKRDRAKAWMKEFLTKRIMPQ